MLIPSIDLMNGRVVQLEQGERLKLEFDNVEDWLARFSWYPIVQVIDLDAAMNRGDNDAIVRRICSARACQVGGGVRTIARAREFLDAGAARVILGSALYTHTDVDVAEATAFSEGLGPQRLIGAIDSRGGHVVINGWKTALPISPEGAAHRLEPFVEAFLYTHVDTEGLLGGINLGAVKSVAAATKRKIIAAGGISSRQEVDALDAMGVDAVVGMALYTGAM